MVCDKVGCDKFVCVCGREAEEMEDGRGSGSDTESKTRTLYTKMWGIPTTTVKLQAQGLAKALFYHVLSIVVTGDQRNVCTGSNVSFKASGLALAENFLCLQIAENISAPNTLSVARYRGAQQ